MGSAWISHRDIGLLQRLLQLCCSVHTEMKDGSGERSIGLAGFEYFGEVLNRPGSAGGDHWDIDRARDCRGQLTIEATACAIAIHAGEQNLARTAFLRFFDPL